MVYALSNVDKALGKASRAKIDYLKAAKRAKKLIDKPEKWTQGRMHIYRVESGIHCYCMTGALNQALWLETMPAEQMKNIPFAGPHPQLTKMLDKVNTDFPILICINDNGIHKIVIKEMNRIIRGLTPKKKAVT